MHASVLERHVWNLSVRWFCGSTPLRNTLVACEHLHIPRVRTITTVSKRMTGNCDAENTIVDLASKSSFDVPCPEASEKRRSRSSMCTALRPSHSVDRRGHGSSGIHLLVCLFQRHLHIPSFTFFPS